MKILFCDLCNESVPQSDLDAGRAFMRKGRVVCPQCDKLMTQREESTAANPFASTATPAAAPAPAGLGASLTPLAAPLPGPDAGHAHGAMGHHPHPPHSGAVRGQRSGSGVAVGLFAMALTACAFYWLMERSDKVNDEIQASLSTLRQEQRDADKRAMDRSTELRGEVLAIQTLINSRVDNEHKAVETSLGELQTRYEGNDASMKELRSAIAELKGILPSLQRHDQELMSSAQKLAQLDSRASTLEADMLDLRKELDKRSVAAAAGAAASGPAPAPQGTPAWMGLVQQLESANSGDRWVAVQGLGETRDPAVAEYILPRLKDVDIFVRMVAARVLGDLASPKASGALIDALGDQDAAVREAAYLALCTVTKKNLPFDPHADASERAKKVKAWQEWWKKAQDEGAAQ